MKQCRPSHSGSGRDKATRRHLPRNAPAGGTPASPHNPKECPPQPAADGAGQNRLTGQRCARRRRTRRITLTPIAPSHVSQWSTSRHRSTHWSAHRHRRTQRRAHRHRRTHRRTDRQRRTHRRTDGSGPGKAIGTPAMSATGALAGLHAPAATGRRRLPAAGDHRRGSATRRRLDAGVAARYERGGCRVRAQRHGGCAQSGAGNYFDVEPIENRHQRQLPIRDPAEPHRRTEVMSTTASIDDRLNLSSADAEHQTRRTDRFQMVTLA